MHARNGGERRKRSEERKKGETREGKAARKRVTEREKRKRKRKREKGRWKGEIRRRNHLLHQWVRVSRYRYILPHMGGFWCVCKRVKRRDIFYIYGYLPLLCSRTGGLWQRANRPLFRSLSLSCLSSLSPFISPRPLVDLSSVASVRCFYRSFLVRSTGGCSVVPRVLLPLTLWPAIHRTHSPATRPCVISHAIPYSVPTMICSRVVPR